MGTEKVALGWYRRAIERVRLALLDESEPKAAKFETEAAARKGVTVLSMLAVPEGITEGGV